MFGEWELNIYPAYDIYGYEAGERFVFSKYDESDNVIEEFEFGYVLCKDEITDEDFYNVYIVINGALDYFENYDVDVSFDRIIKDVIRRYKNYFSEVGLDIKKFI